MSCRTRKVIAVLIAVAVFFICTSAGWADGQAQPQALKTAGITGLRQIDPNLDGNGVNIGIISRSYTYIENEPQNDYQPNTFHKSLQGRSFTFFDQTLKPPDISPHTTAVCSILFGRDENGTNEKLGSFSYEGAIPDANAQVYEFWYFLTNNIFSQKAPAVDILTADIGNPVSDWWTRGLEAMAEKTGITIIAAIGNGSNAYDPPLYPAAGANVIGVGVVDAVNSKDIATALSEFAIARPEHSSCGPTKQQRSKPDIVAPGNCIAAVSNSTEGYEVTGNWTSFATPVAAGAAGLLIQKAKQDENLSDAVSANGGNCVIKALLMNSAVKLPFWHKGQLEKIDDHNCPLDFLQGAGMVNAVGAYKQLVAGKHAPGNVSAAGWDLNELGDSSNSYQLNIKETKDKFITATVIWNNHFSNIFPFKAQPEKDANIRLELWMVNSDGGEALLDYSDSPADNVEHIYCPLDANYSNYKLIVTQTIDQSTPPLREVYAVVWNVEERTQNDNIHWYDLNADGQVDDADTGVLLDSLINNMKSAGSYFIGDMNSDGVFDEADFDILTKQMNRKAAWAEK